MGTALTMLAGAYCAGTYYAHRGFAKEALDTKHGLGWRAYATGMFLFSPITAPLQLAALLVIY